MLPDPGFVVSAFASESSLTTRIAMRVAFPMISVVLRRRLRIDEGGVEVSRKKTFAALDRLERELRPSGYLVGDRFSVADLTAAALCSPLVAPPEFPCLPRGPMPEPMARARESVAARPGVRWVLEMYRRHRGRSAAIAA